MKQGVIPCQLYLKDAIDKGSIELVKIICETGDVQPPLDQFKSAWLSDLEMFRALLAGYHRSPGVDYDSYY